MCIFQNIKPFKSFFDYITDPYDGFFKREKNSGPKWKKIYAHQVCTCKWSPIKARL